MKTRNWLASLALLAVGANTGFAQGTAAVAPAFQSYSFADGYGPTSATLLIVPVAYQQALTRALSFDIYSAWAQGTTTTAGTKSTLNGLVDTRVRANLNVTNSTFFSLSANLPTGKATHNAEEVAVTTSLATELLGFREALWGTGFGLTTGVATAQRWGRTGLGLGASYRLASEFQPTDSIPNYRPGNEVRFRVALDRDVGANNKLTAGVTFQNYSDDKLNGRNLFAPGNRWRGDVAYSFRASPTSTWSLFATEVWRENGDVTLQKVNGSGVAVGDTSFLAGQQNLAVFGLAGATRIGGRDFRPSADFRVLTRKSGEDEGWLSGFGLDMPLRSGNMDVIPAARFSYGKLEGYKTDTKYAVTGFDLSLTLRWGASQ